MSGPDHVGRRRRGVEPRREKAGECACDEAVRPTVGLGWADTVGGYERRLVRSGAHAWELYGRELLPAELYVWDTGSVSSVCVVCASVVVRPSGGGSLAIATPPDRIASRRSGVVARPV